MDYRFYTTKKEPILNSSVKWIINQISKLEYELSDRELKVEGYLVDDLRKVKNQLNSTLNELLSGGDKQKNI